MKKKIGKRKQKREINKLLEENYFTEWIEENCIKEGGSNENSKTVIL